MSQGEIAQEQATPSKPSEVMSQLPDAPTEDSKDFEAIDKPSPKKQKIDDTDDEFVVIEKDDVKDDHVKPAA